MFASSDVHSRRLSRDPHSADEVNKQNGGEHGVDNLWIKMLSVPI
jgi:hypothetical protein